MEYLVLGDTLLTSPSHRLLRGARSAPFNNPTSLSHLLINYSINLTDGPPFRWTLTSYKHPAPAPPMPRSRKLVKVAQSLVRSATIHRLGPRGVVVAAGLTRSPERGMRSL